MIEAKNIKKHFGGVHAVDDVSICVPEGKIIGLIGPNGAGKTSLFNVIAGRYFPDSGKVFLDGEDITFLTPSERFSRGVLRTFQIAHEFSSMTVLENLMMVPDHQIGEQLVNTWFKRKEIKHQEELIRHKAHEVLQFLKIERLKNEAAGNLSGGQKKLLELGRTMMVNAKVVLLDEVGAGVNRTLLAEIGDAIFRLNEEKNYTFCMIEHDIDFISRMCESVIVMVQGQLLMQGTMDEVKQNKEVIDAYLGKRIAKT